MKVNKDRVELWAQALESDRFNQCIGSLRVKKRNTDGTITSYHCSLGVAVEVALEHGLLHLTPPNLVFAVAGMNEILPTVVAAWYGFTDNDPLIIDQSSSWSDHDLRRTSVLNDEGDSFWTIAQAVRATYLKDE